jgi:hypothetical protein
MDYLDTLIRDADPARDLAIPSVDPAATRRAYHRASAGTHGGRRYLVPATGALGAACAAAVVAVIAIPGGTAVAPPSAAAAVLDQAALAAADNPTVTLGPGQYLYSEIHTLAGSYWQWGSPADSAYTIQPETVQTWVAANGADRRLTTYDGPQQFATPAGHEAWVQAMQAGEPSIAPQTNTPSGQYDSQDGPGGFSAPDDLSQLPTNPAALTQLIDTGKTGLNEIGFPEHAAITPAYTFATAAEILATPALNSSAALRIALYEVMADTPGIQLLGTASDHSGRSGTQIAGPVGGGIGSQIPYGANGVRDEVIIDPSTGDVLEISLVNTDPSLNNAQTQSIYGNTVGQTFTWTDYLASGVVNSTAATAGPDTNTGAAGSSRATATNGATGPIS